ncbi:MAG: class I SAM-dependent methyltransferase [Bacteroidia bacterium]|nr:class I SAM-dependent methyltransferase [Bacteroidia bacterium]
MGSHERASHDEINNVTYQRCQFAYEFVLPLIEGKKVLDLGCGLAYGTALMAEHVNEITGVDYDESTIASNKLRYRNISNLTFIRAAVPPLPFSDNSFDVITMFQFIEHLHERKKLLQECFRVLKQGGTLILTTPNAIKSFARNPFHVHEYTFDEMKNEMGGIFPSLELKSLKGNEKVNTYYIENEKMVQKILRWDIFRLHKIIPSSLLMKPYNFITTLMRKTLKKDVNETVSISTSDFVLDENNLAEGWDIYSIAKKSIQN